MSRYFSSNIGANFTPYFFKVLPLKNEMRRPEQFQKTFGVLNVGMVVVGGIFITVGFLGYLKWGDDVAGSLTLNMTPGHM